MDLAKASDLCANGPVASPASKEAKTALEFNVVFECDFRPRQQTHGDVRFSGGGETSRDAVGELGCDQLVSDLRRPGSDIVQTVVTHGDDLRCAPTRKS